MKIALCIIIKDDSEIVGLRRVVASALPAVDSVHITANGKKTKKIESFCKENGFDYSYLAWSDDFSAQRNYNFGRAPENTDYCLWADSDDVIVGAEHIRKIAKQGLANDFDSIFFTYWYGCRFSAEPSYETLEDVELVQSRERLISPKKLYWKSRIHETPVPLSGARERYSKVEYSKDTPIAWLHLGADRSISKESLDKRLDRNRKLLELQLADEREKGDADPRTLLYLMKIYAESDDVGILKDCIAMGKEYMERSGWDAERAICVSLMSRCIGKMGDNKKAAEYLHEAIKEYPYDPLLYFHLARCYYNLGDYRAQKHWTDLGLSLDLEKAHTNMSNLIDMKALSTEMLMRYHFHGERDIRKAYKAAKLHHKVNPTNETKAQMDMLFDLKELDEASERAHKLINYYDSIGEPEAIVQTIDAMPESMRKLPFAWKLYNKYRPIRRWKENEITIFANFHTNHFEKWSPKSLAGGVGGSETAVIVLAREFQQKGFRVVVYGDPREDEGVYEGVTYMPWYAFNKRDKFNIFIQWRGSYMARRISSKRFFVDLHDIFSEQDHIPHIDAIDKIMVKSKYHRNLAPSIADNKFSVISNGI